MFRLKYFVNNIDILGTFLKTLIFINMNEFKKSEIRERKFIKWFIDLKPEHKEFSISEVGDFSENDFVITSGSTYIMGEVKIREIEYNKYDTIILELSKVQRLTEKFKQYKSMSSKLLYFSVHPKSRKVLVFDIINTPGTITYEYAWRQTSDKTKGKDWKPCINYNIKDVLFEINF